MVSTKAVVGFEKNNQTNELNEPIDFEEILQEYKASNFSEQLKNLQQKQNPSQKLEKKYFSENFYQQLKKLQQNLSAKVETPNPKPKKTKRGKSGK